MKPEHLKRGRASNKDPDDGWMPMLSAYDEEKLVRIFRDDDEDKAWSDDEDESKTAKPQPVKNPKKKRIRIEATPTSTGLLGRAPVFLPVSRPEYGKAYAITRTTKWGTVTVSSPRPLTQDHADVLQALLAIKAKSGKKSGCRVIYRMADLRRVLGYRIGQAQRIRLLKDLRDASIEITDDSGEIEAYFSFIDAFKRRKRQRRIKKFGRWVSNPDQQYRVRLSREFLDLCKNDMALYYPDLVPIICSAKHAATKAVSRFLLTHNKIDNHQEKVVFQAVGAMRRNDTMRFHKALIEDGEVIKALGIQHDPEKRVLTYHRDRRKVFVQVPEKDRKVKARITVSACGKT